MWDWSRMPWQLSAIITSEPDHTLKHANTLASLLIMSWGEACLIGVHIYTKDLLMNTCLTFPSLQNSPNIWKAVFWQCLRNVTDSMTKFNLAVSVLKRSLLHAYHFQFENEKCWNEKWNKRDKSQERGSLASHCRHVGRAHDSTRRHFWGTCLRDWMGPINQTQSAVWCTDTHTPTLPSCTHIHNTRKNPNHLSAHTFNL